MLEHPLTWAEKNYSIVITEDGSPSLHWQKAQAPTSEGLNEPGEMMHHRGGALAETEQIYGEVIREALERGLEHFCAVGLGLGYNELMFARELLQRQINVTDGDLKSQTLISYEADPFLVESFMSFLRDPAQDSEINSVYKKILQMLAPDHGVAVCGLLLQLWQDQRWIIEGPLSESSLTQKYPRFEVVLYDAFSSKTSPELWIEGFLMNFIEQRLAQTCLFSTYACTGALKRSLKSHGFVVVLREGFHGKRNSTLGRRS